MDTVVKTNRFYAFILISILLFNSFSCFYNLDKRSLLDWDEAYYLSIVKTWRSATDWIIYNSFNSNAISSGFSDYVMEHGGAINTFAKDGFLAIVFLFSFFFGLSDVSILQVSGTFGILTVWLIYQIGKEVFCKVAGLLSCGILALSVYHLHYSRSGFPQSASVFFLYLALFFYIMACQRKHDSKISKRFLFFNGLSIGYAFTCHYNLLFMLPIFIFFEISNKFAYGTKIIIGDLVKRILLQFLGIMIPIVFFGGLSELTRYILYLNPSYKEAIQGTLGIGKFATYFDRILDFLPIAVFKPTPKDDVISQISHFDLLFYIKLLIQWEGILTVILLAIGLLYLIYRQIRLRVFYEFIILTFFMLPFFFWSLNSWQLSRSFLLAIPAMALIVGGSLAQIFEGKIKKNSSKAFAIVSFLLFFALQSQERVWKELNYASGYPAAIKFMQDHSGIRHLSSQYTISRHFVGRKNALDISVSFENVNLQDKLKYLHNNHGYKYLLLDQMHHAFSELPIVKSAAITKPVFTAPHSTDANVFENGFVKGFADAVSISPRVLEVYELSDIINNLK